VVSLGSGLAALLEPDSLEVLGIASPDGSGDGAQLAREMWGDRVVRETISEVGLAAWRCERTPSGWGWIDLSLRLNTLAAAFDAALA